MILDLLKSVIARFSCINFPLAKTHTFISLKVRGETNYQRQGLKQNRLIISLLIKKMYSVFKAATDLPTLSIRNITIDESKEGC